MGSPEKNVFRRSTFCGSGGCVEVALLDNHEVAVRHSKHLDQPEHRYTSDEWADFVRGVKAGEFDFDRPVGA